MGILSLHDLNLWKFQGYVKDDDSQDNSLATATLTDPGDKWRMRITKVDASYSDSTTTGLLTLKSGTTIVAEKYIHGAGAIDVADWGLPALNLSEAMSAELAASGSGGVIGKVFISGFKHPESA